VGPQYGLASCNLSGTLNFEVSVKILGKFVHSCCNVSEVNEMVLVWTCCLDRRKKCGEYFDGEISRKVAKGYYWQNSM